MNTTAAPGLTGTSWHRSSGAPRCRCALRCTCGGIFTSHNQRCHWLSCSLVSPQGSPQPGSSPVSYSHACNSNSSVKGPHQPMLQTSPARNRQLTFSQLAAPALQNCTLGIPTLPEQPAWRNEAENASSTQSLLRLRALQSQPGTHCINIFHLAEVNRGKRSFYCSTFIFISTAKQLTFYFIFSSLVLLSKAFDQGKHPS